MSVTNNLGKIRYNVRSEWSAGTAYVVDDIVTRVGSSYLCILAGTNQDPITSSSYWTKISEMPRDRGEWSSSTTYYLNDIVGITSTFVYDQYYNWLDEETYICIISSSSNQNPTTTPASWTKVSSGVFNKRLSWLGGPNEGIVPTYAKIADARTGATTGGIGIVTLTSGGSGYTTTSGYPAGLSTATVSFSGGSGTGASGVAYVSTAGTIFAVEITNPGFNYTNPVTVSFSGGGTSPSAPTATAHAYTTRVGVAQTVGSFKGRWHSNCYAGAESWLKYINRNYGLIQYGYNNSTYNTNGTASLNNNQYSPSEASFIHLDWYEGLLPTPDGLPPKVIQLEAGLYNTLVLFNNGEVHYSGYNGSGQAGDGSTTVANSYVRCGYARVNKSGNTVLRGKKAIKIASTAGGDTNASCANYALIENPDGTREIWSWGYNGYGQLGNGNTTPQSTPVKISTSLFGKIIDMWATGGDYGALYVLTDAGFMYACGYNNFGQLGVNDTSSRSSLVLVNVWGTGTSRIKKFVVAGGNIAHSCFVMQENGTLWSWGYNAQGQLGHGHTNNIYAPLTVYTGGYTGSSGANVIGTPSGSAVVAFDVWGTGPNNPCSVYLSTGTSINSTTAYSTGYNGYYNLSTGLADSTNKSVFTAMQVNNGTALTNMIDAVGNSSYASYYNGIFVKKYNGEWYAGGYNNGCAGVGHADAYNIRQYQDPTYTANNYRAKNNILWPQAFDQNYLKCVQRMAYTSSGQTVWVYLKTGQIYVVNSDNTYGTSGARSQGRFIPTRPHGH